MWGNCDSVSSCNSLNTSCPNPFAENLISANMTLVKKQGIHGLPACCITSHVSSYIHPFSEIEHHPPPHLGKGLLEILKLKDSAIVAVRLTHGK